jgi:hypothetical protein
VTFSPILKEHDIDWRKAVANVVWVPAEHRDATVSMAVARRTLRCTEKSFNQLVDLGLPTVEGPDGPQFDSNDLKNVGLYSRTQLTEIELGMRLMLSFMEASVEELTRPRQWRYRLQLVSSAEAGARVLRNVYRPAPEIWGGRLDSCMAIVGPAPEVAGPFFKMVQGSEAVGLLTTRGEVRVLKSPAIRRIIVELLESGVRWQALPPTLTADPDVCMALGAGNCAVLSAVLQQRLAQAGFEAKAYHGWMIAISQVDHGWVDVVDEDGQVKCLDPSFALLATQNGYGTRGFADLVNGSVINRVVPTQAPLDQAYVVGGGDDSVVFIPRPEPEADVAGRGERSSRWRRQRT